MELPTRWVSAVELLAGAALAAGEQVGVDLAFPGSPLLPREPARAAPESAQ